MKEYLEQAAALGHAKAMYVLAYRYALGSIDGKPNYAKAEEWYLKAAELDYAEAMHYLGHHYQDGAFNNGLPSYNEAVKWYRAAWEKGHVKSAEHLVDLFYQGLTADDGTVLAQPNHAQMLQLLEEIAVSDVESVYALNWLGWMYAGNSNACEADYPRALEIYTRGAELGSGYCMLQIGLIYEDGRLGTADLVEAEAWYVKAVKAGEVGAQKALDRVRNTP